MAATVLQRSLPDTTLVRWLSTSTRHMDCLRRSPVGFCPFPYLIYSGIIILELFILDLFWLPLGAPNAPSGFIHNIIIFTIPSFLSDIAFYYRIRFYLWDSIGSTRVINIFSTLSLQVPNWLSCHHVMLGAYPLGRVFVQLLTLFLTLQNHDVSS